MRVIYSGHRYELNEFDPHTGQSMGPSLPLQFVQRAPLHSPVVGTLNQEVLRALIDRVMVLGREVPWDRNGEIVDCLERAILLHELRAIERKVEKGKLLPSAIVTAADGHWVFAGDGMANPMKGI